MVVFLLIQTSFLKIGCLVHKLCFVATDVVGCELYCWNIFSNFQAGGTYLHTRRFFLHLKYLMIYKKNYDAFVYSLHWSCINLFYSVCGRALPSEDKMKNLLGARLIAFQSYAAVGQMIPKSSQHALYTILKCNVQGV